MTIFYMVRHGEKEKGKINPPLTHLGRKQAKKVAGYLSQFPIHFMYVSPLVRTKETASIIGKTLRLLAVEDERLRERMEWVSTEESWDDFIVKWEKGNADPTWKTKNGKSVKDTAKIVKNFLNELSVQHPNKTVVLVTHGGAIRDLLIEEGTQEIQEKIGQLLEPVQECSVTKIIVDNKKMTVEFFNNQDHLQTS